MGRFFSFFTLQVNIELGLEFGTWVADGECRKMCFPVKKSFCEFDEVRALFEPSSGKLDETVKVIFGRLGFTYQIPTVAKYFGGQVVSYHDLCEDG
nr:hypothetical protein Iba_chr04eCG10520 [Ipomoea batatas]